MEHEIPSTLCLSRYSSVLSHTDSVIANRLRIIGRLVLLIPVYYQPKCNACQCPLTFRHILLECRLWRIFLMFVRNISQSHR